MGFVLNWQRKVGYKGDPFVERPSKRTSDYCIDREEEKEKLNLFIIKHHRFGLIQGAKGLGKSTLLAWLEEELRAHFLKLKVIAFHEKRELTKQKPFYEKLLAASMNMLERTVSKPYEKLQHVERVEWVLERLAKRHIVILIDDARELAEENKKFLLRIMEECPNSQLIITGEKELKEFESYGKDKLHIELGSLSVQAMHDLLERRIKLVGGVGTHPFDKEELKRLVDHARGHPKKLLAHAKERAIELSLKVGKPPKHERKFSLPTLRLTKEKRATQSLKEKATTHKKAKVPKKRWFSIKIVKEEEEKKEAILDESLVEPHETIDAELLSEIVNMENEKKAEKEERVEKRENVKQADVDVEDVIQSLVDEMKEEK